MKVYSMSNQSVKTKFTLFLFFVAFFPFVLTFIVFELQKSSFINHQSFCIIFSAIFLGILGGMYFTIRYAGKFEKIMRCLDSLAQNHKHVEIPFQDDKTEFGHMACALLTFRKVLLKVDSLENSYKSLDEIEIPKSQASALEENTKNSIGTILAKTQICMQEILKMNEGIAKLSGNSQAFSALMSEAVQSADSVTSSTDELAFSIKEIGNQVSQAHHITQAAVSTTSHTNKVVQDLSESVERIDKVIGLISDIAEQTNLLALNATIEAARAGEAGKGFTVVAAEVKNLANQTTKATEEIDTQISSIQNATKDSVNAIDEITKTIIEIDKISSSISVAIEQQEETTERIGSKTQAAVANTKSVEEKTALLSREFGEIVENSTAIHEMIAGIMSEAQSLQETLSKN